MQTKLPQKRTKNRRKKKDTSLRGIAFIVDDATLGPKLVFRYPTVFGTSDERKLDVGLSTNVLSRPISNNYKIAPLVINPFVVQQTASTTVDDTNSTTPTSSNSQSKQNKDPFGGLDTDLLAWMFRPKKVLCNQVFELEIDGTVFVSYPIVLDQGPLRLFNVVFAITTGYTGPSVGLVNAYKAVAKRLATTLLHEENRCAYVSEEVSKMFRVWSELRQVSLESKAVSSSSTTKATSLSSSSSSTVTSTNSSASISSTSSVHVSQKDTNSNNNSKSKVSVSSSSSATSSSVEWSERGAGNSEVDLHTLVDVCLARSLLACDIKDIYHKLRQQRMAQVLVNSFIPLSLSLRDPTVHPSTPIRPYQTLLLLKDENVILRSLPRDASPQLHRLIAVANPLKSFEELYIESGIPLAQLYRLAAHLVYWGCGRVVDTLTKHNMYMVHPGADLRPRSPHALEFQLKFGNSLTQNVNNSTTNNSSGTSTSSSSTSSSTTSTPSRKSGKKDRRANKTNKTNKTTSLPQLLSQISVNPGKVGDFLRGLDAPQQLNFIKMLIWLLRHDYLVQLHMYIHIVIPPEWIEQQHSMHSMTSGHHVTGMGGMNEHHLSGINGMNGMRRDNNNKNNNNNVDEGTSSRNGLLRQKLSHSNGSNPMKIQIDDTGNNTGGSQSGTKGNNSGSEMSRSHDRDGHLLGTSYERDAEELLSVGSMSPVGSLKGSLRNMIRRVGDRSGRPRSGSFSRAPLMRPGDVQGYLDSIADDTPVYQMLKRLSPYFHGIRTVEEIMWRETVSRKAIQSVFATYTNILSTTLHTKSASEW